MLEAIINGRYYWVPFARLSKLDLEAPEDLRDFVWMPAHLSFDNGGEVVALVPTRYAGTEATSDKALVLGRRTEWEELAPNVYRGLGQRMFATNDDEYPVMGVRAIIFRSGARSARRRSRCLSRPPIQDRLQPALLDRLTDDEPDKKVEAREARVLSRRRLREAVLRDLAWLFNATQQTGDEMANAPFARRSVVNFGLPAFSGKVASSLDIVELTSAIREAIVTFEPRILPATLEIRALLEAGSIDHHNVIGIEIRGQLWGQPVPMEFLVRTDFDLETGKARLTDLIAPQRVA